MNFIDSMAISIAKSIRSNYAEAASEKVLFYALSLLINSFISCIAVLLISFSTGHLKQAIVVIFFYTILRIISGGTHLSTSLSCCIFTIVLFTLLAHINFDFNYLHIGLILTFISAIILLKTAPHGIENISRIDPKFYPMLKLCSVAVVLSNLAFHSPLLAAVFFVQAFQTTSLAERLTKFLERR